MSLELPRNPAKFLRSLRGAKQHLASDRSQGYNIELEPDGTGNLVSCATIFLTGSECRFTCSMCDLWQYTLDTETSPRSLPMQLERSLQEIASEQQDVRCVKLYNASNFFDVMNIPESDLASLATLVRSFERVVVENHPLLFRKASILDAVKSFASQLDGALEIAMGLESVHPEAMQLLNKQMTLDDFQSAAKCLRELGISSRAFVLLQPPGDSPDESVEWSVRACEFAWDCGVRHCSIIPTRVASGWLTQIQALNQWQPPTAQQLEQSLKLALRRLHGDTPRTGTPHSSIQNVSWDSKAKDRGRIVTADLWDWGRLNGCCELCRDARRHRMEAMNAQQSTDPIETNATGQLNVACGCEIG